MLGEVHFHCHNDAQATGIEMSEHNAQSTFVDGECEMRIRGTMLHDLCQGC